MARRKRQFLSDDDSDSDSSGSDNGNNGNEDDPDTREERALFEDPYKRKRQRKNTKEQAIYGIYGEDSDDDGRQQYRKKKNYTKAPAFVSSENKLELDQQSADEDISDSAGSDNNSDENEGTKENESKTAEEASPDIYPEESEARPRFGGIGSTKGSIGSKHANGFGSTVQSFMSATPSLASPVVVAEAEQTSSAAIKASDSASHHSQFSSPSAFGTTSRNSATTQRFFLRKDETTFPKPAAALPAHERAHFAKLEGSFGARMMAKMGWQAGSGLGATGEGIVTPVESKLRPAKAGIAFQGFKEKTAQSRMEAKRRGEIVSDDETDKSQRRGAREKRDEPWKKKNLAASKKPLKTKIVHKTYEQYIEEAGEQSAHHSGIGMIIDGATLREVSSIADVASASWTPSTDTLRLPELRHNLRLIAESSKSDLDMLAKEAKALTDRKKWLTAEDARLRHRIQDEAKLISRMQQVQIIAEEINGLSNAVASDYDATLDPFSPALFRLVADYPAEFDRYRLDEIVVAAIAPLVRRQVTHWRPLEDPMFILATLRTWKKALRLDISDETGMQVDQYGPTRSAIAPNASPIERMMTPFESLLWNVWLPKVRSCINNEWSADDPQPAVRLYESWSSFLPPFIRDNVLDQLILPKVQKAVMEWHPKRNKNTPLHVLIFAWLPHLGLRLDAVLGDARRKLKAWLKVWEPTDGVPTDLPVWRQVFDTAEWDNLLLRYIVPKLSAYLRNDFQINPTAQDLKPIQLLIPWHSGGLLRQSVFSQIMETEFFPKWLNILHIWLTHTQVSFEEVARWYELWKSTFPQDVQDIPGVAKGFTRGLQLMNKAIELGPDAMTRLPLPDYLAEVRDTGDSGKNKSFSQPKLASRTQQITFRSIVEETAAMHNLLFVPTGRAHETARVPLFRVSQTADGKGGLLVYILDDAVWAPHESGQYHAISLDEMVLRATR